MTKGNCRLWKTGDATRAWDEEPRVVGDAFDQKQKLKKIKTLFDYFWSVLEKERVKQKVAPPCVSRLFPATSPPTSTESKTMPLFPSSAPVRPPLPRLFYLHPSNVELHPCISQLLARVPPARQTDDETATKRSWLSLPACASKKATSGLVLHNEATWRPGVILLCEVKLV